jgi:hypothetical protein
MVLSVSGEYVRYLDHELIVKELEAKIEHLQRWQDGLIKTTVAWSEQGTNAVSLPDAISVVEGMRDEIRRDYTMREPCEEDKSILIFTTHQITALEMVLDRLRALSPGETRKLDKGGTGTQSSRDSRTSVSRLCHSSLSENGKTASDGGGRINTG